MTDLIRADDTFATSLEICYEVLLYLAGRLYKLAPGQTLEFVTSDPTANEKIPAWIDAREYELLSMSALPDGRYRFLIRK
jgi:TusA-related sulfurtransferase